MFRTLAVLLLVSIPSFGGYGVRLILGVGDQAGTRWDGSATAARARIAGIEGWRFDAQDAIDGTSWTAAVRPPRLFGAQQRQAPPVPNGVIIWLDTSDEGAGVSVKTQQGAFSVRLADIPYGKTLRLLGGRVLADRVPMPAQLTSSPEEQDYPAAALDRNGDVWLAWIEFRHNPDHDKIRANYTERPANFDAMKAPTGGDQVFARKSTQGKWGDPVAISNSGGDLYRPAVAVDGGGRAWVFWSANEKGNFDLWARAIENGRPQAPVRLSTAPGSDAFAAATTDSAGRVWVAWQGWRDGKAAIFAAVQEGARFSAPAAVSASSGDEWNPAIAADGAGRVTVAWDSYRNGNYDIYMRTASAPGKWGVEKAAMASARYEAYPSIAYDKSGKLWMAYEEGGEGWGKDFGAYETSGVAVYQGRAVRLRAMDNSGVWQEAAGQPGMLMPGQPSHKMDAPGRQDELTEWLQPDAEAAKNRRASANPPAQRGPRNTMPRLTTDSSGRLWLAFRSAYPIWWNPLGTVWTEYVVSCAGSECTGPVFLAHTDNILDNRPAVLAPRAGELLVIGSSDGRRNLDPAFRVRPRAAGNVISDGYNNDLWANMVTLPPAPAAVATKAAAPPRPAGAVIDSREQASVAALRNYRLPSRDGQLRIVRGEFHRHSEISMDGGGDGTLIDQWRYMLDAGHMDWVGCCDHDNGAGREYSWWTTQKLTDLFYNPGHFSPMFSYERSVAYPEGHRNVVFVERGIRPLPRLPKVSEDTPGKAPDTLMFYDYLRQFNGVVASHTSGTGMGTDWRDNDPNLEPVVEIYQGDRQNYEMPGAPRSNSADDSIGGWRPKGFVSLALEMGYKLAFEASSDHISTHMSYCNIYAKDLTRESLLDAFKKRHVYAATDNILADVRSGDHMLGDVFSTSTAPELKVKLTGTAPFAKVHIVKDNQYVYSVEPKKAAVEFTWRDNAPSAGKQSYYYVRGEQQDGEVVWVSPLWITYTGK